MRYNLRVILCWTLQIVAAVILLQTLFFKLNGAPESVAIFSALGAEPWGRIGSGVFEGIVGLLLVTGRGAPWGAMGAVFVMVGAIFSHLFVLGIEVMDDGGTLFVLAWAVLLASVGVLALRRAQWASAVLGRGASRSAIEVAR